MSGWRIALQCSLLAIWWLVKLLLMYEAFGLLSCLTLVGFVICNIFVFWQLTEKA